MNENSFASAGWASIVMAVILPTAFIVAGIEGAAFELGAVDHAVGIGISDFLFLILGAVGIYVLLSLKRLMYERYSFLGLNLIVGLAIFWTIVNYGGSFLLELFFEFTSPSAVEGAILTSTVFWVVCIVGFGIIDIVIGLILVLQRHRFSTPIRIFAMFSLIAGISEATVILSFFAMLFYPLALIALAIAFLKPDEIVELI